MELPLWLVQPALAGKSLSLRGLTRFFGGLHITMGCSLDLPRCRVRNEARREIGQGRQGRVSCQEGLSWHFNLFPFFFFLGGGVPMNIRGKYLILRLLLGHPPPFFVGK